TDEQDQLAERCAVARQAEVEARLAVRTGEERARALSGRADAMDRAARQEREARAQALARKQRRTRESAIASAVAMGATTTLGHVQESLRLAVAERDAAEAAHQAHDAELKELRTRIRALAGE